MEEACNDKRKRLFPEVVTFWAWFAQIAGSNSSCQRAVALVQDWYAKAKLPVPSMDNSAYCRARKRLSEDTLGFVSERIDAFVEDRVQEYHRWRGFRLKAIDGTSVKLMDTEANQREFPQPRSQKPGCGFPVMGWVGVLDLETGLLEKFMTSAWSEQDSTIAHQLCDSFEEGDLLIGDRAYCSYSLIAKLLSSNVQSVTRLHQQREAKLDWRLGKRLDKHSRLVEWKKPYRHQSTALDREQWKQLPDTLSIRLVRVRFTNREGKRQTMYIATTLTDTEAYPTSEIALLYLERWKIEVAFRDIKTTMGLEKLNVKTPEMARKSLRMIQIAYNLIKALQMEAVEAKPVVAGELSFKAALDVLNEFRSSFHSLAERPRLLANAADQLGERIAERILTIRPNRREPRAVKTRPKPFQYLSSNRKNFVEIQHRSKYRKAA